jgi:DNA-binding CsgD family transcriptional regulator
MHRPPKHRENRQLRLTRREAQVAVLIAAGLTAKAVGIRLQISPDTVRTHTRSIFLKLRVRNRVEMAGRIFRMQDEGPE